MGAFTTVRNYADPSYLGNAPGDDAGEPVVTDSSSAGNAAAEPKPDTLATLLGKIADYIPAEGLVGYLTAYSLVSGAKDGGPIVAAWVGLGVAIIVVALFGLFSVRSIAKDKEVDRNRALLGTVISIALIALYVSLLPENPFLQIPNWISWVPQIIALIATVALGLWGDKLAVPKGEKTS